MSNAARSVPGPQPATNPQDRVLSRLLASAAERYGDHTLFAAGESRWTYRESCEVAARCAGALDAAGIVRGDRVAILCGNRAEFAEIFLGCGWLGAIAVPINVAARGAQLRHIFVNSAARLLVIEDRFVDVLRDLGGDLPIEAIWIVGGSVAGEFCGLRAVAAPASGPAIEAAALGPGDLLAILYTSGTTGVSKGVCCSHAHVYWWGQNSAELLGVTEGDVLLTCLPLFHINAINTFYQALLRGATLVLEPRFSASGFSQTLAQSRANVTYLLGAMVPILLAQKPSPYDRQHNVRIALGPAVPEAFREPFRVRFGIDLIDGYGSTETNFVIASGIEDRIPGSMGRLRPGFSARIVDADDNPLADGEPGELALRADEPFAFASGYFGMAEKTVEAWRNLWFHTGDRVVRNEAGLYRFVDRLKDSIRRRGENISAFEVEQALTGHPAIADAAVFPVPSELAEDEVMAVIVTRPGAAPSPEEIIDFCLPRLSYFAIPRYLDFVEALPLTENGKVQKFKLRERGVTLSAWDREAAGYRLRRAPSGV